MASQFQNRLVGAIVLVALGVIVLPDILDTQKKHQQDFAAIPLKPALQEPENSPDLPPAMNQPLHPLPSSQPDLPATVDPMQGNNKLDRTADVAPPPVAPTTTASSTSVNPPVVSKSPPAKPTKPVEVAKVPEKVVEKTPEKPKPEPAPSGKAYVVQLGALKNANKVNEIIAKLRLAGYKAYSQPSPAAAGQLNRIYVGPDTSKEKLVFALDDMQRITGLRGQVRSFDPVRP
ncbi:MAG: cell division protein DedD [Plesiomonas sp.]